MITLSYKLNHYAYKLQNRNKTIIKSEPKKNIYKMHPSDNFEDSKLLI